MKREELIVDLWVASSIKKFKNFFNFVVVGYVWNAQLITSQLSFTSFSFIQLTRELKLINGLPSCRLQVKERQRWRNEGKQSFRNEVQLRRGLVPSHNPPNSIKQAAQHCSIQLIKINFTPQLLCLFSLSMAGRAAFISSLILICLHSHYAKTNQMIPFNPISLHSINLFNFLRMALNAAENKRIDFIRHFLYWTLKLKGLIGLELEWMCWEENL